MRKGQGYHCFKFLRSTFLDATHPGVVISCHVLWRVFMTRGFSLPQAAQRVPAGLGRPGREAGRDPPGPRAVLPSPCAS